MDDVRTVATQSRRATLAATGLLAAVSIALLLSLLSGDAGASHDPYTTDSDLDGCVDSKELGGVPSQRGQRDPNNFWDSLDTPHRGGAISMGDHVRVIQRFGSSGDSNIDPLTEPPPYPAYHTALDRSLLGPNRWNLGPANGSGMKLDITLSLAQFGTKCH